MSHRHAFLSGLLIALSGCGPGVGDYSERIGDSNLYFHNTGIIQRFIGVVESGKYSKVVLGTRVITYIARDGIAIVAKQPAKDWECENGALVTSVERKLEYWIIRLSDSKVDGPFAYAELRTLADEHGLASDYEEMSPEYMESRLIEETIRDCKNPRRI